MSVSDIEEEMREIYEIELSTSAISIITNKVNQAVQEWQNRPLDPVYLIVWMDGIVFKVRDNGKIINKTVYLCVGLKQNGLKELLGMWAVNWSAGYIDYLYRQSEWIYGYRPYCIHSVIHSNLRSTSDYKLL